MTSRINRVAAGEWPIAWPSGEAVFVRTFASLVWWSRKVFKISSVSGSFKDLLVLPCFTPTWGNDPYYLLIYVSKWVAQLPSSFFCVPKRFVFLRKNPSNPSFPSHIIGGVSVPRRLVQTSANSGAITLDGSGEPSWKKKRVEEPSQKHTRSIFLSKIK